MDGEINKPIAAIEVTYRMLPGPDPSDITIRTDRQRLYTRGQIERAMARQINHPEIISSRICWRPEFIEDFMQGREINL